MIAELVFRDEVDNYLDYHRRTSRVCRQVLNAMRGQLSDLQTWAEANGINPLQPSQEAMRCYERYLRSRKLPAANIRSRLGTLADFSEHCYLHGDSERAASIVDAYPRLAA